MTAENLARESLRLLSDEGARREMRAGLADVKEKLSLELKENGKITIDVPGVGNGKVELNSGIESAPHEFPVKIANFRRTYQN